MENKPKRSGMQAWAKYSGAGMEMAVTIGVFTAGGYYLDKFLNSKPWLTLMFLLLGLGAALYRLFKQLQ